MNYIDRKTLEWLNDQRATLNLQPLAELPRGNYRQSKTCVLANGWEQSAGYRATVSTETMVVDRGYKRVLLVSPPWYVRHFIRSFDSPYTARHERYKGHMPAEQIPKTVPTVTPSWLDRLRTAKAIRRAEAEIAAERVQAARIERQRAERREIAFTEATAYFVDMADIATASERDDEFQRRIIRVAHAPRTEDEVTLN